ncbi:MAG: 5'-methylthioadenosine/S-adenosylhomocysteine nucleosidase, partial [bacterium]|nr:5'-methylthioadenosine/S-adenosylhomocysteine nucleosidase [bacterium]
MPIGLICAMTEELAVLKEKLNLTQLPAGGPWPMYQSPTGEILATISGIGKVNAAACASHLLVNSRVECLIGIGVAGGIAADLRIGDIIIGTSALQHDFDVQVAGYEKGVIPRMDVSVFPADDKLVMMAIEAAESMNARTGKILTGDR